MNFSKPSCRTPRRPLALLFGLTICLPTLQAADALNFFNNWFVTGDYAVAGVGLRGLGVNGFASGAISMSGVPNGAEPVAAFLYWSSIEFTPTPGAGDGFFNGFRIRGAVVGDPQNPACYSSGGTTGSANAVGRVYRADVLRYIPVNPMNIRQANGTHTVRLPDSGGSGNGNTVFANGASLVVIYRIVVPGNPAAAPLRSVVIYNGAFTLEKRAQGFQQTVAGFYQAATSPGAKITNIVASGQAGFSAPLSVNGITLGTGLFAGSAGGRWDNPTSAFTLAAGASSFSVSAEAGDNQTCLTWAATITSMVVADSDRDGLLDVWETSGLHRNTQVTPATFGTCADYPAEPCVNLPAMGSDRLKKDVFVQVDWMHGRGDGTGGTDGLGTHNHIPKLAALDALSKTFSPRGINLHFDVGNNYQGIQSGCGNAPCNFIVPAAVAKGGAAIDELTLLCRDTPAHACEYRQPYPVLSFQFGFASVRDGNQRANISARFAQNRKDIFHYALFAHALAGPFDANGKPVDPITKQPTTTPRSYSGIAQRPGGGFMVTLGLWRSDFADNDQVGSALVQAGTIMHELGHNLSLSHGGLSSKPNCMPNYQSVMNYLYQTRGLTDGGGVQRLDFSDGLLSGLGESSLSESTTLGMLKYRLRYYAPFNPAIDPPAAAAKLTCPGLPAAGLPPMVRLENTFPTFIDWDHNGVLTPGTLSQQDLNFNNIFAEVFADQPDWTSLNLQQIGSAPNFGGLSVGALATDGGALATDGGALATDAGALATDGGVFATDGGAFATDAGAFATDGGVFATDGGVFATDGGAFATDAGDLDFETVVLSTIDPPPPPGSCPTCGVFAISKVDRITLNWTAPDTGRIASYNVYRSDSANPIPRRIASIPGGATAFSYDDVVDSSLTLYNTTYTYSVTSVVLIDSKQNESLPSNTASGVVKRLYVAGGNLERQYGTPNPATLYSVSGLDPSAAPLNVCTTNATATSPVGVYTIICSGPGVVNSINTVVYTNGTLTVKPKPVTVASLSASDKVYDGGTSAVITACTLSGALPGDDVGCGGNGTFANPNAGTWTVTAAGMVLSGSAAGNYVLTAGLVTTTAKITPKPVTATVTAANKTYDGTTAAVTSCALNGVLGVDLGSVICVASAASFSSADAGTRTVTATGISLSGAKSGNYALPSTTATTSATILPAPQVITFGPLAGKFFGDPPITLAATASSGLTVSFALSTPGTWQCSTSGVTVTITGVGDCSITATQSGSLNYLPAVPVTQAFHIAGFVAVGSMVTARSYHTATLLANGKILVAGGFDRSGASLASAELYDPLTKTFSPTGGNLPNKTAGGTATLLTSGPDKGKVLVVGGGNSSSEIYDPASNQWSSGGGISGQRSYHTATLLPNGKVLISGGSDSSGKTTNTALLYDPVSRSYSNTGNMTVEREFHTSILLTSGPNSGKVLIVGGRSSSGRNFTYLSKAELYDPSTERFSAAGNLITPRFAHTATLLAVGANSGKILIAGGAGASGSMASAEFYDPSAGTFAAAGLMSVARRDFVAFLFGTGVVMAGGRTDSTTLASAEALQGSVFQPAGTMTVARTGHAATQLANGAVLLTGGQGTTGVSIANAELLQ